MDTLRHHFGFRHDPFPQNVPVKDLYPLPALEPLRQRVFFALDQKAIAVITGDVGSGKSTSLRYVSSKCHKSEYELITIVGGNFSPMELYRQILLNFGMSYLSFQVSIMISKIRELILEIASIIDIYQHNERKVYVSSVYDLLEEKYGSENLPGTARTLRNYISRLIKSGEIERTANRRFYAPVEELPFGKQLQVDFGETVIETGERIYIFASVLSASRFRYVAVQNRPFKTLDVVLHLLDCFEYIGGIPEEIVIDQDSTLVVSENHGDILLTKGFTQFKDMSKNSSYSRYSTSFKLAVNLGIADQADISSLPSSTRHNFRNARFHRYSRQGVRGADPASGSGERNP
jgi:energy-coupling factor transporter ATP-binding protein EcfA2